MTTQEKRNPLPPGRYWLTVISQAGESKLDAFFAWARANPSRVTVEKSEPAGGGTNNGAFVIFRVNTLPLRFDQAQFGFPNVAGPEIQTASDTVERPPVPGAADALGDIFGGLARALDAFDPRAKVVVALGVFYLLTRKND
jgi:hypothetical protein